MSALRGARTPLRILICALGGEGGGVLMNWVVAAARASGWRVQATSVPGVAQRTGSTSYYIEIWDGGEIRDGGKVRDGARRERETRAGGTAPALSLVPMPGRVDVVVASELVEAARAMEGGFVSPRSTTLIASTSRVYSTAEKIAMGDGRFDADAVRTAARTLAKTAHLLDLQGLAAQHETFISATLFGALAGSGALPWPVEVSRSVLGTGDAAAASLRGMEAAVAAVRAGRDDGGEVETPSADTLPPAFSGVLAFPGAEALPASLRDVIAHGHARVLDFQDERYAALYDERVVALLAVADLSDPPALHAVTEASRRLALWMAYEDVARVADLKTRRERFRRIRSESRMQPGQILRVTDYLKPRAEELADVMPVGIGGWVRARAEAGKRFPLLGRGIRIRSNGVAGYWMLRCVASLKHVRRRSLRYHHEQQAIEEWLSALAVALPASAAFAGALAELPRVRKGYSDTMQRGLAAWHGIMEAVVRPALSSGVTAREADRLREAVAAAMADERHAALGPVLRGDGRPAVGVPVPFVKPERRTTNVH